MDSNANYRWTGKSKVKPNYYPLFQSIEFENLLDNSLWLHKKIIERLYDTVTLIDEIIDTTNPKKYDSILKKSRTETNNERLTINQ